MTKNTKSIGGYFQLETNDFGTIYHDNAYALNSGRNCLELILKNNYYQHIYIPYYTCDAIMEPINKLNLSFSFYHINDNFLPILPNTLNENSVILYTNYFGIMVNNCKSVVNTFKSVIIDNSQAFYEFPVQGTATFYSPRKFFGVADGGFVYNTKEQTHLEFDNSEKRMAYLIKSVEENKENSYVDFTNSEKSLINQPIKKMSRITQKILNGIDYDLVRDKRIHNFNFLHKKLNSTNLLSPLINQMSYICPMVYPYFQKNNKNLRSQLIDSKIYVPQYWPNVLNWSPENSYEKELTQNLVCIPIDQRINQIELTRILDFILA